MSDEKHSDSLFAQGSRLTPEDAASLEVSLASEPTDLGARSQAFGYWFNRLNAIRVGTVQDDEEVSSRKVFEHALRIVEDHPESDAARMAMPASHPSREPQLYIRLEASWLAHVERRSESPEILGNAANFFRYAEPERAAALYRRAIERSPLGGRWRREFADHLLHRCILVGIEYRRRPAQRDSLKKALGEEAQAVLEPLLTSSSGAEALDLRMLCAGAAIASGDLDGAERHARNYISPDCQPANEILSTHALRRHHAHTVLGVVAASREEWEEAERRLALSADDFESCMPAPNLPYLSLARALVAAGRRQAVVDYLTRCASKEFSRPGRIENWIAILNAGGTPDGEWEYS